MSTVRRQHLRPAFLLFLCGLVVALWAAAALATEPFSPATPEDTGLTSEGLDQLASIVSGYLDEGQIVGAELMVIKNRRTVLHRSFGLRDREDGTAMALDTIFNIRSMTKPLTGLAAQMLIDAGELNLDDRIASILPGFTNLEAKDITVRHLLTHRSGLPLSILKSVDQYRNLQAMANAVGREGPQFDPGSKFWYSDAGSDVLGAIVSKVSGMPLEDFWQERIFTPLGMSDSFVPQDENDPRWDRLATLYIGQPGQWYPFWDPSQGALYPFAWGSQTIYSTTQDYARVLALLMDSGQAGSTRLLSDAAIARIMTPVSRLTGMGTDRRAPTGFKGLKTYYGQMLVLYTEGEVDLEANVDTARPVVFGHSGSDGTFAWAWPEEDLMVLYFTQSRGGISGLNLEYWIDELLVQPERTTLSPHSSADIYDEIIGDYAADFGSLRNTTIKVQMSNGRPALDLGSGRTVELRDPDENGRWAFTISDRTSVSFTRNEEGAIDALRMHEGPWSFEAPRIGVAIDPDIDLARLQKYLGTYRVNGMDVEITALIHNQRLALDKSALPTNLPADIFELMPPDSIGRWEYRVNPRLSVEFLTDDDGAVSGLRLFKDGELDGTASKL